MSLFGIFVLFVADINCIPSSQITSGFHEGFQYTNSKKMSGCPVGIPWESPGRVDPHFSTRCDSRSHKSIFQLYVERLRRRPVGLSACQGVGVLMCGRAHADLFRELK